MLRYPPDPQNRRFLIFFRGEDKQSHGNQQDERKYKQEGGQAFPSPQRQKSGKFGDQLKFYTLVHNILKFGIPSQLRDHFIEFWVHYTYIFFVKDLI